MGILSPPRKGRFPGDREKFVVSDGPKERMNLCLSSRNTQSLSGGTSQSSPFFKYRKSSPWSLHPHTNSKPKPNCINIPLTASLGSKFGQSCIYRMISIPATQKLQISVFFSANTIQEEQPTTGRVASFHQTAPIIHGDCFLFKLFTGLDVRARFSTEKSHS